MVKRWKVLMLALAALAATGGPAEGAVSKSGRRLVLVSALETFGQAKHAWLYNFLDASTISLGQAALSGSYQSVSVLSRSNATRARFVSTLRSLSGLSSVQAIDVILSLHGSNNRLWFDDGSVSTATLEGELRQIPRRSKFRLLYSLACYGATHRDEFLRGGFRTAVGARRVNTASASEYPAFLAAWALGNPVNAIFAVTNADPALQVSDSIAVGMGFSDPDSIKLIGGIPNLTIQSNAQ